MLRRLMLRKEEHCELKTEESLRLLVKLVDEQNEILVKLYYHFVPNKLEIKFSHVKKGVIDMSSPSVTLNLTATASVIASVAETQGGQPFTYNPAHIVWSAQNSGIVNFTTDPTTGNTKITPVIVGTTQIGAVDTDTNATAVGTVTVEMVNNVLTMSFGVPTA